MAKSEVLCPYRSTPLVDVGDIPTFNVEDIATGLEAGRDNPPTSLWAVSCGKCHKLLGILPPAPK